MKKLNIISAILAAAASSAGIFFNVYKDIPWAVAQMKGQDAVTILAAAVLLITAFKKNAKPLIITAGINAYLIYTYLFYALETKMNPFFHVYLAIVLMSLISLVHAVSRFRRVQTATAKKGSRAFSIIYLSIIASVLTFLWNSDIIATLAGHPILETPTNEPLTIVYVFDLTFVIPAIIYTLYLLKKNNSFGIPLCGIVLVKCVTMGAALLGMTIGVWAGGFKLETFLAVFWFLLAAGGIAALNLFLKSSTINE